jgi:hypothetical protein
MIRVSKDSSMRSPVIAVGPLAFEFARIGRGASNLYKGKSLPWRERDAPRFPVSSFFWLREVERCR